MWVEPGCARRTGAIGCFFMMAAGLLCFCGAVQDRQYGSTKACNSKYCAIILYLVHDVREIAIIYGQKSGARRSTCMFSGGLGLGLAQGRVRFAILYCERDNKDELRLAPTTTTTCARADSTHPALLLWRAARMISECSY